MSIKRNLWKVGIAIAGLLLLLVFMMWLSVPAAGAQGGTLGSATPGTVTVQATPTANSTIVAETAKEQLIKLQRDNERSFNAWFWNNGVALISSLALVLAGVVTVFKYFSDRKAERERRDEEQKRWLKDQEAEREKRAEERFQKAVEGLGSEREEAKVGVAILLRTFLRPGYEQFYTQTFDLAVANLRLRNVDPNTPEPLDTLSQALITAFKESFPLARKSMKEEDPHFNPQSLDASYTQLDKANLNYADLEQAWMSGAFLREASLFKANLSEANLALANLRRANLMEAKLNEASLFGTNLIGAKLDGAKLNGAQLFGTNLLGADLPGADLSKANIEDALYLYGTNLRGVNGLTKEQLETCKAKGAIIDENPATLVGVDFSGMDLSGINLSGADLSDAKFVEAKLVGTYLNGATLVGVDLTNAYLLDAHLHLANLREAILSRTTISDTDLSDADLTGVHLENALDLRKTNLRGAKGLAKEQLKAYKAMGAIIDEEAAVSPSQPTVIPPQPGPDSNAQAPSSSPTQGSVPTPDTAESSATSSKPGSEP